MTKGKRIGIRPLFLFIPLLMMQLGCEKSADVEVPDTKTQLVIFSFLSPEDSLIRVRVERTYPVFGKREDYNTIKTAVVTISEAGGASMAVPYDNHVEEYNLTTSVFPLQPGKTYTIHASYNGMTAEGSCVIPVELVAVREFTQKSFSNSNGDGIRHYCKWLDKPGKGDYYRLDVNMVYRYIDFTGDTVSSTSLVDRYLFSDYATDGQLMTGVIEGFNNNIGSSDTLSYYSTLLLHTDAHYYEYHKRRFNYFGDDPFSEPTPQYSNVKGGLGVVSGYRLMRFDKKK